jgi:hypothetical protein
MTIAMGFNQNKIRHNFKSTPAGRQIMITALDSNDTETIRQIKNHTLDIQEDFSKGNFTKPFFIHAEQVPGTKVTTEKKDLIKYSIVDMKNESTLILTTSDKQLIDAIGLAISLLVIASRSKDFRESLTVFQLIVIIG